MCIILRMSYAPLQNLIHEYSEHLNNRDFVERSRDVIEMDVRTLDTAIAAIPAED
jgi:hypothetical protein